MCVPMKKYRLRQAALFDTTRTYSDLLAQIEPINISDVEVLLSPFVDSEQAENTNRQLAVSAAHITLTKDFFMLASRTSAGLDLPRR